MQYRPDVRSSYTGQTYAATWAAMRADVARTRGAVAQPEADGSSSYLPRLTNGQLAALVLAWRRAAARGNVSWPVWADLANAALGRSETEPRFDMSRARRQATADDAALELFWTATAELASRLDDAGTVVRPVPVQWTQDSYEQLARDAWETIKRERDEAEAAIPRTPLLPPLPDAPPELPLPPGDIIDVITDPLKPIRRKVRRVAIWAALLAGGAVYFATRRRR